MSRPDRSRRAVILTLGGAVGAAALLGLPASLAWSQAGQQLPHLTDADPTAKALGYVEDASKVDKTRFPSFKPGAKCGTCNFYQGKAGQPYGPCQIFPGKSVNTNGWCASHNPKPGS